MRKPTRLPHFDYSTPGAYFVTICVQDYKCILSTIVGGGVLDAPQVQLTKIGSLVERNILAGNRCPGIWVDKYVIMPNHIHLLVSVKETASGGTSKTPSPTNAMIPHFISTFKRFCHRDIGYKIFQRSYHDHVIRNERDYQRIWTYIEGNPARWNEDCFYVKDYQRDVEDAVPYDKEFCL